MDEMNLRDKTKTLLSLQYELLGQEGESSCGATRLGALAPTLRMPIHTGC